MKKKNIFIFGDRQEIFELLKKSSKFTVYNIKKKNIFSDILKMKNADILHTAYFPYYAFICLVTKILFHKKMTITLNGLIWEESKEMSLVFLLINKIITFFCLRYADHIFALSNFTKNEYIKKYPFIKNKISVVFLPINKITTPSSHVKYHKKQIITVTNFNFKAKCEGLMKIIQIAPILPNYHFLIIGKNGKYLKKYILLTRDIKNITIKTNLRFENLIKQYLSSSIYIHISNLDTLGRSILEAQILQLPTIVVRGYNGCGEAIYHNKVIENDNKIIIKEINRVIDDNPKPAREWVLKYFNDKVILTNYEKGFRCLL